LGQSSVPGSCGADPNQEDPASLGREPITGRYRYMHRNVTGTKREA
jgi:hypothetical protein